MSTRPEGLLNGYQRKPLDPLANAWKTTPTPNPKSQDTASSNHMGVGGCFCPGGGLRAADCPGITKNPAKMDELAQDIHAFACQPLTEAYNMGVGNPDGFTPAYVDAYEEKLLSFITTHDAHLRDAVLAAIGEDDDVVNVFPFPNWQITDKDKFQAAAAEIINWYKKQLRIKVTAIYGSQEKS